MSTTGESQTENFLQKQRSAPTDRPAEGSRQGEEAARCHQNSAP